MSFSKIQIFLVRHGETEWSATGKHTSITDIPLTNQGRKEVGLIKHILDTITFDHIFSSPRLRAKETAALLGFQNRVEIMHELSEWYYGEYEGLTTVEIRKTVPDWSIFQHSTPGGETIQEITERVDKVIDGIKNSEKRYLLIGHSHCLRVLIARWLELPASAGAHFFLETGCINILTKEREIPIIALMNGQNIFPQLFHC